MRLRTKGAGGRNGAVIAVCVLALSITASAATSKVLESRRYNSIYEQLTRTIEQDVQRYLEEYETVEEGVYLNPQVGSQPAGGGLSQEEMDAIISSITSSLEYQLIRDLIDANETASQAQMDALRESIYSHVETELAGRSVTAELSQTDMESIVAAVSAIVKSNTMNTLYEFQSGNETDIANLQTSVDGDLSKINTKLSEYGNKFTSVSDQLDKLNNELDKLEDSSGTDMKSLQNYINDLNRSHNALANDVANLANFVNFSETAQMSLAQQVEANKQLIGNLISLLDSSYQSLSGRLDELSVSAGSISDRLNKTNAMLDDYVAGSVTKDELMQQVTLTKQAMQAELDQMDSSMTTDMSGTRAMISQLDALYSQLSAQTGALDQATKDSLLDVKTSISGSITSVQSEVDLLRQEITSMGGSLNQTMASLATLSQSFGELSDSVAQYAQTVTMLESQLNDRFDKNGDATILNRLEGVETVNGEQTTSINQLNTSLTDLTNQFNALKLLYEGTNTKFENFLNNGAVYVQRWDPDTKTLYLAPYDNSGSSSSTP